MPRPRKDIGWPPKVPANFPLTVTTRGYVARIGGKPKWIAGKVSPADALKAYHRKAAALLSRNVPAKALSKPKPGQVLTMTDLLREWLRNRTADAERGELSLSQFRALKLSGRRIDAALGYVPVHEWTPDRTRELYYQLEGDHGADFAKRAVSHLRDACRYGEDQGWCQPVGIGATVVKKLTRRQQVRMTWDIYSPAEVRKILLRIDRKIRVADGRDLPMLVQFRAMVYLALNGGFGAQELSELRKEQVDAVRGSLGHRRGKTGAYHFVPLWPETLNAIEPVLAQRPGDPLLFRTREGNPWARMTPGLKSGRLSRTIAHDNVNAVFTQVVKPMGLKRRGVGFYKFKHLASSIADEAGDTHATFALYGHALPSVKGHYVAVSEERIRAVSNHVRRVLLVPPSA